MNEFDAEKRDELHLAEDGDGSGNDSAKQVPNDEPTVNPADHASGERPKHTAYESGNYTFVRNGNPSGQEYTTPEGGHGFVYTPPTAPEGNGIGRKLLLAMCVIGAVMLLMGGCFLGAWVVARSEESPFGDRHDPGSGESYEVPGTTDGLVIIEKDERESLESGKDGSSDPGFEVVTDSASLNIPVSADATIHKNKSQREDKDGDGKPDLAYDDQGRVITSAGDHILTVPTIIAKVSSSVVEISTETLMQSDWIGQYITGGAGSGVIIAEEGYIITNHHVVDGADSIVVRLNDGTEFAATLVGSDEQTDVAILWIDAGDYPLTAATLGSSYDLVAGEDILAIGNPLEIGRAHV